MLGQKPRPCSNGRQGLPQRCVARASRNALPSNVRGRRPLSGRPLPPPADNGRRAVKGPLAPRAGALSPWPCGRLSLGELLPDGDGLLLALRCLDLHVLRSAGCTNGHISLMQLQTCTNRAGTCIGLLKHLHSHSHSKPCKCECSQELILCISCWLAERWHDHAPQQHAATSYM